MLAGTIGEPLANGSPIVPASNPLNPYNQDVPWTGRPLGNAYRYSPVDARQEDDFQSHRFAATYNLDLGEYLEGEMAISPSRYSPKSRL